MEISETAFPARTYLVWRKEIPIANIADQEMWQSAFEGVNAAIQESGLQYAGAGAGLYFAWDEEGDTTDFGIGMPVSGTADLPEGELSFVRVDESKALLSVVLGEYSQLGDAHHALLEEIQERNLTMTLAVEEYEVMGMQNPDPKNWKTNLYYLYES